MTGNDLLDFQEVVFRATVRNVIFCATLPYYVAQQMQRHHALDSAAAEAAESTSVVFLDQYRDDREARQSMSCR
jgi:hypothetical protein